MNVVIFETNTIFRNDLTNKIELMLSSIDRNSEIIIYTDNTEKILKFVMNTKETLLFFLGILDENKQPIGLELAKQINEYNQNHIIVLITNYPNLIQFDIKTKTIIFAYIAKFSPCFDSELKFTLVSVLSLYNKNNLIVKNQFALIHSISFDDIYSIESVKGLHKVVVYHSNGYVETYKSLKSVYNRIDHNKFAMCNSSCIINLNKILLFDRKNRMLTTLDKRQHEISIVRLRGLLNEFRNFH